jgi:pullulanase
MTAQRVQVTTEGGAGVGVDLLSPLRPAKGRASMYTITTAEPLDLAKRYQVRVEGVGERSIRLGRILLDPDRFYDPDARLGANYSPERTTFRVFAPTATHVRVVIAETPESRDGEGADETVERDLEPAGRGIWQAVVQGDLQGRFYAYKLTGPAFDPQAEVTDVYATCTQGRHARTLIVDLASTDPPGFREHTFRNPGSPADAVIYEMHVRDFTIAASSGVHHKGKYLGLTESGTHLPGDASIKTGLDHLVELGVTHVQLMPVQDFDNVEDDDAYNWGYMPVHFNAPDGWYATDARGPAKIRELKQAVQALHERGIGAIMDVVYNHTAGGAGFERLVPGYYHRLTPAGRFSNGSGCGNEFHSESPMGRRFILDSVRFWAEEYKIDGFRFDLMGLIDLETMKRIKAELEKIRPGILVYGEPWTGGATPLSPVTGKRQVSGTGIAAFNDRMRDAIKGERDGGPPGFIQAGDRCDGVVTGLKGAIDDWAANPSDSINYFEAHDNLTAWDKLLQSAPSASNTIRKRMMRFAALILFSSQGRPFAHSGQEFCRSKQGHANSYDQPDEVNRIDWGLKKANADVYAYHRGMIALRKAHPLLRLPTREQVESRISFPDPPHERCIVYRLDGTGLEGESAGAILVLLNGHTRQISFPLPAGTWAIHADADRADLHPIGEAAGKIGVPAHSGVLLLR